MTNAIQRKTWPNLLKYSDGFYDLFDKIPNSDRDSELEALLRAHLDKRAKRAIHNRDWMEASQRLREAVKHDAYLTWSSKRRKKLISAFKALEGAIKAFEELENGGLKALQYAALQLNDGSEVDILALRNNIKRLISSRESLSAQLGELPDSTHRTARRNYSLIQRLAEAWEVLLDEKPSIYQSQGDRSEAGPFESLLQAVGDHLQLSKYNANRPFSARSAIGAWQDDKKRPRPDNIPT